MSRGLGKLQRFIKAQIHRAEREYHVEAQCLRAAGRDVVDDCERTFVLTWPDIRYLIEENQDFNPDGPDGPYRISKSLERSAKRALHLLVKRGEIARWRGGDGDLNTYMTSKMDQGLREATEAAFAHIEAKSNGKSESKGKSKGKGKGKSKGKGRGKRRARLG